MVKFKQFLREDGAIAGKIELATTTLKEFKPFAEKMFDRMNRNLEEELPNFDKNYLLAQKRAKEGTTKRNDMPVIDDVRHLQALLKRGSIDINSPRTTKGNPFPNGLNAKTGKDWLKHGLKIFDGESDDDIISVSMEKIEVGKLHPIQKQIYIDKSITKMTKETHQQSINFLTGKNTISVVSKDNQIIDGHHRFFTSMIIDPSLKVNVLKINLPINILLPLTLSYSDATGNKRNE